MNIAVAEHAAREGWTRKRKSNLFSNGMDVEAYTLISDYVK